MRSFNALLRKDLKSYFAQPTGYVLLVIFVGVASYLFFFVSAFRTNEEASIRELFSVQSLFTLPWLLVIFIPASTMRLLAEEQRDGTLEILLTQPVQTWSVLLAKFVAGLVFVGVAIIATLGIPIALILADKPLDIGAFIAQYVGSIFLAASFISIGLFTSSTTRNQIVAFIMGVFLTAVLMLVGLDIVIDSLPNRVSELLLTLSPVTHFEKIARGVIDLRDVLYFLALVSTFLSASYLMIRSKSLSHQSPQFRNLQLGVAGLIVFSLLVGWFGNSIGGRLDLTEDKLYTLSQGTEDILDELDDILTVKLYASKDPPVDISVATRDARDFLEDFSARSGGKVKVVRRFPDPSDQEEVYEAQLAGVPAMQFNVRGQTEIGVEFGYLGLSMTYADSRETIPFIGTTIEGFEYRIASLANKMLGQAQSKVAFLTGYGGPNVDESLTLFWSELDKQYDVTTLPPEITRSDLNDVDVLVIAGFTTEVPPDVVAVLNDYLSSGGKAMVLVDPVLIGQELAGIPNQFSFADFVESYGVFVESDIVFDLESNETIPFQTQVGNILMPYPYWPHVPTVDASVTGEVQSVLFPWASSLGTDTSMGNVSFITLLSTLPTGGVDRDFRNLSPDSPALEEAARQTFNVDVGVAVESLVPGETGEAFRLVVIGDSDWLTDQIVGSNWDNVILGLNLIDWLSQEETLAEIRSKVVTSRRLDYSSTAQQNLIQYGNILGLPVVFVVIGFAAYFRRKRQSSQEYRREK